MFGAGSCRRSRREGRASGRPQPEHRAAGGNRRGLADRLHDHLAHRVAGGGVDSAAVHGRRGGPPVPRVRGDAGDHDPDLGRGVADAGADDVGALARRRGAARRALRRRGAARLRPRDRRLRPLARRRAQAPAADAGGRAGHAAADGAAVPGDSEGPVPDPGHRTTAGAHRSRARRLVPAHARPAARGRRGDARRPRGGHAGLVRRRRRGQQHDAAHRPHAGEPEAEDRARRPGHRDAAAARTRGSRARRHAVPAADARPDHRCRDRAHRIPRRARGRRTPPR